jgi:hypothetical protein
VRLMWSLLRPNILSIYFQNCSIIPPNAALTIIRGPPNQIEKDSNGQTTTIRLIGRMQRECIEELKAQIKAGGASVTLDLNEVSLVRLGCHSLPSNMSNRRHLPRSLFPLYIRLDHQRAEQKGIKVAVAGGEKKH